MPSYHHPNTEISRSGKKGIGLFVTRPIAQGEILVITGGHIIHRSELKAHPKPEHPFQVEKDFLISPLDMEKYDGIFAVNHSCEPTAGIRGQTTLVALRDLKTGDEICYDYVMTDSDPEGAVTFQMECLCGKPTCRRKITDMDWRNKALQAKYEGYFSSYLAKRINTGL